VTGKDRQGGKNDDDDDDDDDPDPHPLFSRANFFILS
jgi:hypothetical protein